MGFDDGTADRKPIPMPFALVVKKELNNWRICAGVYAVPPSRTWRAEGLPPPAGSGPAARAAVRNLAHGMDAVEEEIDDHLLQLDRIAVHRRQAGREARASAPPDA